MLKAVIILTFCSVIRTRARLVGDGIHDLMYYHLRQYRSAFVIKQLYSQLVGEVCGCRKREGIGEPYLAHTLNTVRDLVVVYRKVEGTQSIHRYFILFHTSAPEGSIGKG